MIIDTLAAVIGLVKLGPTARYMLVELFSKMTPEEQNELAALLKLHPVVLNTIADNLLQKVSAFKSGNLDVWKNVVRSEVAELTKLQPALV